MRKILLILVLFLGAFFMLTHLYMVEEVSQTFVQGDWIILALAFIVQIFWLVSLAATYRSIYRTLGIEETIEPLFIQAMAANFVNVVTPSGGVGGVSVFIMKAREKGVSSARVMIAGLLFFVFEYFSTLVVLGLGLIVLIRRDQLVFGEVVATGILIALSLFVTFLVFLGIRSKESLAHILIWLAQFVKKLGSVFKRKWTVGNIQVNRFASDVSWGLGEIQKNPKNILWTMALALSGKALLLVIFFLSFEAFHVPFSVGTLVAGFSMGYLFTLVSPTPAGVGVVEGVLTVVLGSLNVAISAATLVTLAYRGLTFWLPLIYGFVAFRVIKKNSDTNGL